MTKVKIYSYFFISAFLVVLVAALVNASSPIEYASEDVTVAKKAIPKIEHLPTPEPLKGVYMTACVAAMPSFRERIVSLIDETELNSVVIDIKDYTGIVSIDVKIAEMDETSTGCKVADMKEFVKELHDRGIYVIGRVTVFQDPFYARAHPELAVKKKSDGSVWKDKKGLSFIDVGAKEYWDYIIQISKQSEKIGFDEINFDYIRFPSDGDMADIDFTHTGTMTKREILRQFFEYLDHNLKDTEIKTSADLFGMVTTNTDDLGIGQILENALPYFDYISPMVYPSHYPPSFNSWPDPNKVPYEIVKFSLDSAVKRIEEFASTTEHYWLNANSAGQASSTAFSKRQISRLNKNQIRPWLQDNDYPIHYTSEMVRAQIQATYDVGLTSWMLWDPTNTYTREALLLE